MNIQNPTRQAKLHLKYSLLMHKKHLLQVKENLNVLIIGFLKIHHR